MGNTTAIESQFDKKRLRKADVSKNFVHTYEATKYLSNILSLPISPFDTDTNLDNYMNEYLRTYKECNINNKNIYILGETHDDEWDTYLWSYHIVSQLFYMKKNINFDNSSIICENGDASYILFSFRHSFLVPQAVRDNNKYVEKSIVSDIY